MKCIVKFLFVAMLILKGYSANAQLITYSASQLDSLLVKGSKDVFIFMYTDWCKFCAAMKQTTFKSKEVVQLMNEKFYFVPFDAEHKNDIKLNGNTYQYMPSGAGTGVHQLAQALANEQAPTYPFMAVLNKKGQVLFTYDSYLTAKELIAVLNQLMQQTKALQ